MRNDRIFPALLLAFVMAAAAAFIGCSGNDEEDDGPGKDEYGMCRNMAQVAYWQCQDDCEAQFPDDACGLAKCIYGSENDDPVGCGITYYTAAVGCEKYSVGYNPYPDIDKCRLECEKAHGACVDASCDDTTQCDQAYEDCRAGC